MRLVVSVSGQVLEAIDGSTVVNRYRISTSRFGVGEREGSYRTPRGKHRVRAKIGAGLPAGSVLRGRRPTGEVLTAAMLESAPEQDWILSRIMWLTGCEPGRNRLGKVDSMQRYIYIHGTPHESELGTPASVGCVRMANQDVIELFDAVAIGAEVDIQE